MQREGFEPGVTLISLQARLRQGALIAVAGITLSGSMSAFAAGQDAAFTIGNYPVEAQAKNAVAAKKKALEDGRNAAFRSLMKRLVPVTAYDRISSLNGTDAAVFADGVAVRSERNSATEYIASLDFSFRADEVRNLLRRQGIPFIDEQAPTTVVVPIVRKSEADQANLSNQWRSIWRDLDVKNTLSPLRIEPLKPVVHVDTIRMALGTDSNAQRILATEYQSERVVLMVADVDEAAKAVQVTVVGQDAVGEVNWQQRYELLDNDIAYTLELVSVVSLGVLEGRWKAFKTDRLGGIGALSAATVPVRLQVSFSGLPEWNLIRRKLLETPGVNDVQIDAVSARSADVRLTYPGGGGSLAAALVAEGLTLSQAGDRWLAALRY